jgi:High potential iron-sulfur protein
MRDSFSRRAVLVELGAAAAVALGAPRARADAPARLDPRDPAAIALGYVTDATRVDARREPTYVAGHACANCLQLQGRAGDPFRPCPAFGGKLVDVRGWCRAWTPEM